MLILTRDEIYRMKPSGESEASTRSASSKRLLVRTPGTVGRRSRRAHDNLECVKRHARPLARTTVLHPFGRIADTAPERPFVSAAGGKKVRGPKSSGAYCFSW